MVCHCTLAGTRACLSCSRYQNEMPFAYQPFVPYQPARVIERNVRKEVKHGEGRMIITKGTVLVPVDNHHHGSARFVVDSFDVGPGFTRIIDKDGWWIGDTELNEHYKPSAIDVSEAAQSGESR